MKATSAHELVQTVTCATAGCANELTSRRRGRGLDAYCADCKAARLADLALSRVARAAKLALDAGEPGPYEARAQALARLGGELDTALADEARARLKVAELKARWGRAVTVLARAEGL